MSIDLFAGTALDGITCPHADQAHLLASRCQKGQSGMKPVPAFCFPDLKITQPVQAFGVHGRESRGHVLGYDNARHILGKLL